ncbi:excinuclease ABC subunit C [Spiroplasma chinense]|uniref:UvrABC system protein C n=1 Tax=Spiroplasma chinense TaxID=216932 RepID=A0A5B9Y393_9MOLU|nr:excinuclease ABC subunit UvrC [Spiroplasma chinense]QEH61578.1 excinuclease ABC subunit C [Spiroplasma chinense]
MIIENQIKLIPEKPGCYVYYNKNKQVIYVGKAKNLKRRVSSYFNKAHNIKTTKLVRDIVSFETFITQNEKESLLLEQNLIKKYKPRYNVVLNDDKKYPYIAITNEKDPKYIYIRNFDKKNKASFGPLPDGSSARNILYALERIYPLRRCNGNLGEPCIYYHINQCSGACFKEVEPKYYQDQIEKVTNFFNGKSNDVEKRLNEKMVRAAENLQFEEAQRIKELIGHLSFTLTKQDVDLNDNLNRDVFNYFEYEEYICLNVLFYRNGKLTLKNNEIIKNDGQDIAELFKSFIMQIYTKNLVPDYVLVPKEIEVGDLKSIFGDRLIDDSLENSKRLIELSKDNAKEFLLQKIHYSDQVQVTKQDILNELKDAFNLPTYPFHIEMYDVANILDEFVTGAMVVFKEGLPSKNDFRKYNIDIDQEGDYHRMYDMIYRRYKRDINNPEKFADLIIMDGGIIQVHAAKKALDELEIKVPVIGLVKNDKHKTEYVLDLNEQKVYLDKQSELFKLLESFQLRVHNFAISGFRKRQVKGTIKNNELENVKGIGSLTIKKLYEKFINLENMSQASSEELNEIIKNKNVSERLVEYLKGRKENEQSKN